MSSGRYFQRLSVCPLAQLSTDWFHSLLASPFNGVFSAASTFPTSRYQIHDLFSRSRVIRTSSSNSQFNRRKPKHWKWLSFTIFLPCHVLGLTLCISGGTMALIGGLTLWFFGIPGILIIVGVVMVLISNVIERFALPAEAAEKFHRISREFVRLFEPESKM